MKKFLSIIITLFSLNANSQIKNLAEKLGYEKDAKLLIIHADDIGVAHSVNQASFDGFLNNSINSSVSRSHQLNVLVGMSKWYVLLNSMFIYYLLLLL